MQVSGPRSAREGTVLDPFPQPSARGRRIVLAEERALLFGPAPIALLVHSDRRGAYERKPERREEGELARLAPERVGLAEQIVEPAQIGQRVRIVEHGRARVSLEAHLP